MQFLIPTEDTLQEVGSKELDIPRIIQPGLIIEGMLEETIKRYDSDKKLILSSEKRKVI